MKMKQISESTIKITIGLNDLEERGLQVADFLIPQEKTEDFFYAVMEELDLPMQFRMGGMLSFKVTPKQDRIDIFVTKTDFDDQFAQGLQEQFPDIEGLSAEEFMGHLEENLRARMGDADFMEDQESAVSVDDEFTHYVLTFSTLLEAVTFSQLVDFPVEASELYKYDGSYYLTLLISLIDQPTGYADRVYARILEHAKPSERSRAYLREHGHLLREEGAVDDLAALPEV